MGLTIAIITGFLGVILAHDQVLKYRDKLASAKGLRSLLGELAENQPRVERLFASYSEYQRYMNWSDEEFKSHQKQLLVYQSWFEKTIENALEQIPDSMEEEDFPQEVELFELYLKFFTQDFRPIEFLLECLSRFTNQAQIYAVWHTVSLEYVTIPQEMYQKVQDFLLRSKPADESFVLAVDFLTFALDMETVTDKSVVFKPLCDEIEKRLVGCTPENRILLQDALEEIDTTL